MNMRPWHVRPNAIVCSLEVLARGEAVRSGSIIDQRLEIATRNAIDRNDGQEGAEEVLKLRAADVCGCCIHRLRSSRIHPISQRCRVRIAGGLGVRSSEYAAGDVTAGKAALENGRAACHTTAFGKDGFGPSRAGAVGRKSSTLAGTPTRLRWPKRTYLGDHARSVPHQLRGQGAGHVDAGCQSPLGGHSGLHAGEIGHLDGTRSIFLYFIHKRRWLSRSYGRYWQHHDFGD